MNYIKTNNKWARQRGTTLIELSVVIAVILLLVGVLFVGVTAWRDGANRAACLVNISSLQKAMRGYQNLHADDSNVTGVDIAGLVTAGYFGTAPLCPSSKTAYNVSSATFPAAGVQWATCTNTTPHTPASTANW